MQLCTKPPKQNCKLLRRDLHHLLVTALTCNSVIASQVPSGLLPALELDGQLYTESDLIMRVLEERFPERPMLPSKGSPDYHRAQRLLRLERQLFGVWLQWLCRSW